MAASVTCLKQSLSDLSAAKLSFLSPYCPQSGEAVGSSEAAGRVDEDTRSWESQLP